MCRQAHRSALMIECNRVELPTHQTSEGDHHGEEDNDDGGHHHDEGNHNDHRIEMAVFVHRPRFGYLRGGLFRRLLSSQMDIVRKF